MAQVEVENRPVGFGELSNRIADSLRDFLGGSCVRGIGHGVVSEAISFRPPRIGPTQFAGSVDQDPQEPRKHVALALVLRPMLDCGKERVLNQVLRFVKIPSQMAGHSKELRGGGVEDRGKVCGPSPLLEAEKVALCE